MQNARDSAAGVYIKIERAKSHIRELTEAIAAFLESDPYALVVQEEPETGDLVYRLRVLRETPPEWGAILGDATHNLRSALDLLASELVLVGGGKLTDQTGFPIARDVHALKSMLPAKMGGAPPAAIRLIRAMNPYHGGNEALWRLHRLDIMDKHRLLLAVGSAHRNIILDGARLLAAAFKDDPTFHLHPEMSLPFALRPANRQWPLQDGAVVYRVMAAARHVGDHEAPQFTFEIAFGEGDVVKGEEILGTLQGLVVAVEDVVAKLVPYLRDSEQEKADPQL